MTRRMAPGSGAIRIVGCNLAKLVPDAKRGDGGEIRGLRVCQNEDCKLLQNRDRTGALNIEVQFGRLFRGQGPIRSMIVEEKELTLHRRCLECE